MFWFFLGMAIISLICSLIFLNNQTQLWGYHKCTCILGHTKIFRFLPGVRASRFYEDTHFHPEYDRTWEDYKL